MARVYRELEPKEICSTADGLCRRIDARFPGSGLGKVANELRALAGQTEARIDRLQATPWSLRALTWTAAALLIVLALVAPVFINIRQEAPGLTELMQGIDSAVNNVVFISIAIWFLVTLEQRPKRRAALEALHELRSLAHIIDLHQLKKDPEFVMSPELATAEAVPQPMSRLTLGRYLDYCSELLSIVSKLAALYAERVADARVLDAVNDVEQLTGDLSSKIWQKIVILDTVAAREGDTA